MKNGRSELRDPVESMMDEKQAKDDEMALDISNLDPVSIPVTAARVSRPFDGYPLKKMKLGGNTVCVTNLVLHNHINNPVAQDPSGPKVKGKRVMTYHNRWIRDVDNGGVGNVAVNFDRPIETAKGTFFGADVPDPYVRCQLCFKYNVKTQRIEVDNRYMLLDADQTGPLKRCFEQVINPQLKIERAADYISGVTKDSVDIPEA